jgi:O-antigen/teichoic acid export membrane protein
VALNTAAQFGSYGFNSALAMIVGIVVVRHLGRVEYGVMAFVIAYLSFFQILTSLGADTVVIREVARQPQRASEIVGGALSLRLVLSSGTMVLSWLILPFLGVDWRTGAFVILYSTTFLFSFSGLYLVLFNVELRSHVPNVILGAWALVYAIVRLALVATGARVVHFLTADVFSGAVALLLSMWIAVRRSSLRAHLRIDKPLWRILVTEGWPIAVANGLIALHWRIDQVLLFRLGGAAELGGYAVAVRISEVWSLVANASIVSVFPLLSRKALEGPSGIDGMLTLAYRYLYMFILPIAVALGMYSDVVLNVLFGPGFAGAGTALMVLALAEVAVFSNSVTYNALFAMNLQREAALVAGTALIVNTGMNVWLIPRAGGTGAALASLVSYATVPILVLVSVRARRVGIAALRLLIRPAVAAGIAAGLLWLLGPPPFVGVLLIALVYPAALAAVGAVDRRDFNLVGGLFSTKAVSRQSRQPI